MSVRFVSSTFSIHGGYAIDSGALEIELFGNAPVLSHDLVEVIGTLDLVGDDGYTNADLDLILGFAPELGDTFTIIDNDGSDAIIGTFAQGPSISATFDSLSYEFDIDYASGTGNDVTLTVRRIVPEPGSALLLLGGAPLLMRRRRAAA